MTRSGLPTLPEALTWLRQAWDERETPSRLHQREHDGWGLMYAPAFARRLGARPGDQRCDHEPRKGPCECPWRYPTWRAMTLLRKRNPVAHDVVLTLVINGYDVRGLETLGFREGALLGAIRRLFDVYERAPVRTPYSAKSEAQRVAEGAVA